MLAPVLHTLRLIAGRLHSDDEGGVAIEYALLAALIALAIAVGAEVLGGAISGFFEGISDYLGTIDMPGGGG